MNTNQPLRFTQISAFNPGRLTDDEIERTFIARVKLFEHLFEQLIAEKPGSIPQHLLESKIETLGGMPPETTPDWEEELNDGGAGVDDE